MLDRARQAAQAARKIGVVEVLGEQSGWVALQAAIAVCADAVLIPEIPCDLKLVASRLKDKVSLRRPYGLVVVAEGARFLDAAKGPGRSPPPSRRPCRRWRPGMPASTSSIDRVRPPRRSRTGCSCCSPQETYPLVLGPWVRGGTPTAVDRQLGLGYGAGAVRALKAGKNGTMVAFVPPDMKFVPLTDAINKVRTVPADSEFMQIAQLPRHLPREGAVMSSPVNPSALTGIVLNIQRYCSHDGPGIRTNVFLKGCSLRCKWCGNPESIAPKPELSYDPRKCTGREACGVCLKPPFPEGAFYVPEGADDDKVKVNWHLATGCDEALASLCPTGALEMFGKRMTVDEVLDEVEKDDSFYRTTGGGITLSGGECLLQPDFSAALLAGAHERGFNTAIETACNVPWRFVEKVLPHVDTMLHDHKMTDPGAPQEVGRRRQQADPGELQEGLRDVPRTSTSSPARRSFPASTPTRSTSGRSWRSSAPTRT